MHGRNLRLFNEPEGAFNLFKMSARKDLYLAISDALKTLTSSSGSTYGKGSLERPSKTLLAFHAPL